MIRLLCLLGILVATGVQAAPALVCQVTARIPYSANMAHDSDSTLIFVQTALLVQERRSNTSRIRNWTVVADGPEQLMAIDPARQATLLIDRPGNRFAISGVQRQVRGYCRVNDLP